MTAIVLLGPPGAGKGTVAEVFSEKGYTHISTGELLREEILQETPLGVEAKLRLDDGKFVSDEIVVGMIRNILGKAGAADKFLFDGFPRTLIQAESLDRLLHEFGGRLAEVVQLDCPDELIIKRLSGRRTCTECGTVYHIAYNPPSCADKCDNDACDLQLRSDDAPDTVRKRLGIYKERTAPLIDYYQGKGAIRRVDASLSIEEVRNAVLEGLGT